MYINDIADQVSPGTICRLFADDCLLYLPMHSLEDQLILQRDLDESSKMPYFYELCDTVLLSVTNSKYLGIRLSEDLGWGVQVDAACNKSAKGAYM